MNVESAQVHVEVEEVSVEGSRTPGTPRNEFSLLSTSAPPVWASPASFVDAGAGKVERGTPTPGTPTHELSVLSTLTPALWATPAKFTEPDKVYPFREIISMQSLNTSGDAGGATGELSADKPKAEKTEFVANQTVEGSRAAMNEVLIHSPIVMNGILQETSVNVNGILDSTGPISEYNLSPLSSYMTVPPNNPQILVEDVLKLSLLSPEESDVTVYEQTPCGIQPKWHSRSSSGVKIVGAIEKILADSIPGKHEETDIAMVEKCTSKTYIVPESKPVAEELVRSSVEIMSVVATPFFPNSDSLTSAVLQERPVDEINGPIQPPTNEFAVNIPNGRSQSVDGFTRDSERLASEGPDCEELLGGFLVRPCPSLRSFRKRIAKGFLVGLLVVIVAFIVLMFVLNRR